MFETADFTLGPVGSRALTLALCRRILFEGAARANPIIQSSRSAFAEPTQIASFSAVILRTNCLARPGLSQNAPLNWSDVRHA
jgi:hypothetical protein